MDYSQIQPNDPRLNWGHTQLKILSDLWQQRAILGTGVRVGVLDSGFIPNHPDLNIFPKSQIDFTDGAPGIGVSGSHGCYCSGVIAAAGSEVFGVAPETTVAYGRVKLNSRSIADGIEWLLTVRPAIHAISISLEIFEENENPADFQAMKDAIAKAEEKGKVVVAALGNDFARDEEMIPRFPAAFDTVLAVGALKANGELHEESGMHHCVDQVAPGHQLITTEQGGGTFKNFQRTSAAAAFAAGCVALLLQVVRDNNLNVSPDQIRKLLRDTATYPFSHSTKCHSNLFGCGLINPVGAIEKLLLTGADPI